MTIFDSIKYPISDRITSHEWHQLSLKFKVHWQYLYRSNPTRDIHDNVIPLRKYIMEYDNQQDKIQCTGKEYKLKQQIKTLLIQAGNNDNP